MTDEDVRQNAVTDIYLGQQPFIPRTWLADAVHTHLRDDSCRHVLITADAGMGKSSFMAWLSTRHPVAPRYFIRIDSVAPHASADSVHLLMSIGRQLAALRPRLMANDRLDIQVHQSARRVRPGATVVGMTVDTLFANPFRDTAVLVRQKTGANEGSQIGIRAEKVVDSEWQLSPAQLQQLALFEPAAKLAEQEPHAQIVVLIDGLDEVRAQDGGRGQTVLDWLADCPRLPPNVRVVATCRPDDALLGLYRLRQRVRLREITVDPDHEHVRDDLREYGRQLARDRSLRRALTEHGVSLDNTVRAVARQARGNFLYLVSWARHLRHAISAGRRADVVALSDQRALPTDLEALHELFVRLLRRAAGAAWDTVHRPVLAALTVARGPLRAGHIAILAGHQTPALVEVALADMPQFVTVTGSRFGMFHRSLAEYLTAEQTRALAPEHWIDPTVTNRQAAMELIRAFGADWSRCTDDYALTNVVDHLVTALRGEQSTQDHDWCVTTLRQLLSDSGFIRQKATVVGPVRTVVDFAEAYLAMHRHTASQADQLPLLLAVHTLASTNGAIDGDALQSGLGYRRDFDEFYGRVLDHLGDLEFVTAHVPDSTDPDLQPVSLWAEFAEILASRLRRRNEFDAAENLLERIHTQRGDQSRLLYERGYVHFTQGRVEEALDHLRESAEAAEQAGRDFGRWISTLVHDQIAYFAGRLDAATYADTLVEGLAFFTEEAARGGAHGERWVMNVHGHVLALASLEGDGTTALHEWEILSENEWAMRERPDLLHLWEARAALAQRDYQRCADLHALLLGPDALDATPPETEGIAWLLLDYGRALAGVGHQDEAVKAWRQVLRCADTTAAWPWKPQARALLDSVGANHT